MNSTLTTEQEKLLKELNNAGGFSDQKKYLPLLKTNAVYTFNHKTQQYICSTNHPLFAIQFRFNLITDRIDTDSSEQRRFSLIHTFLTEWILKKEEPSPDLIPNIRQLHRRHICIPLIISVPNFLRQSLLDIMEELAIEHTQISVDYKTAKCPRCDSITEADVEDQVFLCHNCGAEYT